MSFDVGERLRLMRESYDLSQRELSRRCGVSNATISQIESGRLNPTIGLLRRILGGVPTTLAAFCAEKPFEIEDRIFYKAEELVEIAKGGISYRQVGQRLRNRAIQLLHERYEVDASTGRIPLSHEGQQCGLVLKGRLEVYIDGRRRVLGPGDAYYFESIRPHRFRNVGKTVCELVTARTPAKF